MLNAFLKIVIVFLEASIKILESWINGPSKKKILKAFAVAGSTFLKSIIFILSMMVKKEVTPVKSEKFINPLDKMTVTSPYGMRKHPISGLQKMHTGIDLAGNLSTKIYAVQEGIVLKSKNSNDGYGNRIFITHKDFVKHNVDSIYCHLSKLLVKAGDKVKQGQVIGYVGTTGNSTGPHLHFEIQLNNKKVDPAQFLKDNK